MDKEKKTMFPCGHSFCAICTEGFLQKKGEFEGKYLCAKCRYSCNKDQIIW